MYIFRYSCYLVLLKIKVPNEDQMDIATFFGMLKIIFEIAFSNKVNARIFQEI